MTTRATRGLLLGLAILGWLGGLASLRSVRAEQFRVENKIFLGDDKEPRAESTTIFYENVVYDYLLKPAEVTVFDRDHGRFVLLDLNRRVKSEIATERVREFSERLKQWACDQSDTLLKFLANPKFDVAYDETTGELTYSSSWMTYRLMTGDAASEVVARQYAEFSDWYGQLNTMLNPGTRPPFARMAVNAGLEARQRIPREVTLTFRKENLLARRIVVRSEHQLVRQLVQSDRDRIAQTDQFIAIFSPLGFDEYQKKMQQ
jgi:hypothetical protein